MKKPDLKNVRRVLIIRTRAIGDVILTTPFIRAVKKAMPQAEIDYLVEPFAEPALRGNPNLSNIFTIKRQAIKKDPPNVRQLRKNELKKRGFFAKMIQTADLYRTLISRKYDIVFDLWGNLRTAFLAFITGAKTRVGFNFRGRKYFYNFRVEPDIRPKYNVYYHMDLLKPLGIPEDGPQTEFFTSQEDEDFAEAAYNDMGGGKGTL
ncbi:MAG TPA: glycosyltransferase family 9 protein, partial [Candidatus Goldiibacteriota bacterium]|nr:glycosyltransferase family 9 protein [Candidatus Goldiibacteriota bacterium]